MDSKVTEVKKVIVPFLDVFWKELGLPISPLGDTDAIDFQVAILNFKITEVKNIILYLQEVNYAKSKRLKCRWPWLD